MPSHKLRKRQLKINLQIAYKVDELEGKELMPFIDVDRNSQKDKDILISWCKHFAMKNEPYIVKINTGETGERLILWKERKA